VGYDDDQSATAAATTSWGRFRRPRLEQVCPSGTPGAAGRYEQT